MDIHGHVDHRLKTTSIKKKNTLKIEMSNKKELWHTATESLILG